MVLRRRALAGAALGLAATATLVGPAVLDLAPASAAPALSPRAEGNPMVGLAAIALDALRARDAATYTEARDGLADAVAAQFGLPAEQVRLAWSWGVDDGRRMIALLSAMTQLGTPYRNARSEPGQAFDCSGLTSFAWQEAGISLAHQSGTQIRSARPVPAEWVKPGDLVWYPGHVMMSIGVEDLIIHAPHSGAVVELDHASRIRRVGSVI